MMNIEKDPWSRRLDFSMLSAWLCMSLILAVIAFVVFGVDFRGYYAAARVLVAGGNPYDYHLVAKVLQDVTGEMGNNPYYYPPWFAWLFVPLTFIPYQIARGVWMVFNVIIWNVGLWQLGKIVGWPQEGWRRYLLFTLTTFSFAWITWRYEQAGILVFMILIALILSFQKQNWTATGIWLALLLIKPNVTLIVAGGIGLWLLRKGKMRAVWTATFTLLVLLFLSTMITPDWYQPFSEEGFGQGLTVALDGPDRVVAIRINTTFLDWLRTLGVNESSRIALYALAVVFGLFVFFWTIYHAASILELISILLLISYALTPYALQYDYPPLVIALLWALSRCVLSPKGRAIGLLLAGLVFSVIFWQQNISWAYWIVIGLLCITGWSIILARSYSESTSGITNNS